MATVIYPPKESKNTIPPANENFPETPDLADVSNPPPPAPVFNYSGLDVNSLYAIAKQKVDGELSNSIYFHSRLRSGDITTVPFGVVSPTVVISEIESVLHALAEVVLGVTH